MNQHLKQRLVGATVLVVLGIIFLPMILDKPEIGETEPVVMNIELPDNDGRPVKEKQPAQTIPSEVIARYEASEKEYKPRDTQALQKAIDITQGNTTKQKAGISQIEKSSAPIEGKQRWAVQMGSFSRKENADRLVQRLKSQKYSAYYEDVDSNGKIVFRVMVGRFGSRSDVEKMQQKLDKKEQTKSLIVTLH